MSRRKVVQLKLDFVNKRVKERFRHNVVFCEEMGRGPNWVTDWNRKPTPKNLPSPEEAARMCAILQVEPEEILVSPEDVELVSSLIQSEKKENPADHEADGIDQEIVNLLARLNPENLQRAADFARGLLASQDTVSSEDK